MESNLTFLVQDKDHSKTLVGKLLKCKSSQHQNPRFSILCKNNILRLQGRSRPNMNSFFTTASHENEIRPCR